MASTSSEVERQCDSGVQLLCNAKTSNLVLKPSWKTKTTTKKQKC